MTPERRARIALKQGETAARRGETAARLGPIGLWEAQVELIARQIREAVAAERAACAEIARTYRKVIVAGSGPAANRERSAIEATASGIAAAIDARGEP